MFNQPEIRIWTQTLEALVDLCEILPWHKSELKVTAKVATQGWIRFDLSFNSAFINCHNTPVTALFPH